jgi:hypothetical protein
LDVRAPGSREEHTRREEKNGVQTVQFLKAVSWCRTPVIQEELADIAKRTDDPEIKNVLPAGKQ